MANRITMNSLSLQKTFPKIYRDFFSQCPLVCSSPRSFTWFGEQAVKYDGLTLRQNLPLKTYVGLIPNKKQNIRITSYAYFDPNSQTFHKDDFDPYLTEKTEKYFLKFLTDVCQIKKPIGFNIHILNELPLERGLGSGAILVALLTSALILNQKLDQQDVISWKNKNCLELKENKDLKFDFLFKTIWKWESFLFPNASGSNLTSILPSSVPVLFFSKKTKSNPAQNQPRLEELDSIDSSFYQIIKLDEITNHLTSWSWPFDYGLIYTGENRDVHDSQAQIKEFKTKLIKDSQNCFIDLKKYLGKSKTLIGKIYQENNELWNKYTDCLPINSFQSYIAFKKIFSQGFSSDLLKNLVELLNKEQYLFNLLNLSSPNCDRLISSFRLLAKKSGQEDILAAAKISGTVRRGDILFVANSYQLRNKIDQIVAELKSKFNPDINLDFASWLDNSSQEQGLKIEQSWLQGIYSKYVQKDTLIQKTFTSSETSIQLLLEEKIKKEEIDLLLDNINHKIFIKGKTLTSKQLPSQKTAIEILKILLENQQSSITSNKLPRSSYSTNRNDMQGKIIGPLKKLVKKYTKKDLDLKTNGTLIKFYLKINLDDLKISIIDKII